MKWIISLALCISFFQARASISYSQLVEKRIDEVVSVFENSTTHIQYDYIENIHDGRGYTAGKVGFTTGTGDLIEVVKLYLKTNKNEELESLVPILKEKAEKYTDDVTGLEKLPDIWKECAKDPNFIKAQDEVADQMYRQPARRYLLKYKLKTAMAYLVFYDTIVQHGNGDDPDGFMGIIKKMRTTHLNEVDFLNEFLTQREHVLLNPFDEKTKEEWAESVDRVYALKRLLSKKNMGLTGTVTVEVWNNQYTLD
ncbi:MAG: chitosanase [Pseudobdellovibrio sp.]